MKGLALGFSKVGITTADDFTDYIEEVSNIPDNMPWLEEDDEGFHVAKGARPTQIFSRGKTYYMCYLRIWRYSLSRKNSKVKKAVQWAIDKLSNI